MGGNNTCTPWKPQSLTSTQEERDGGIPLTLTRGVLAGPLEKQTERWKGLAVCMSRYSVVIQLFPEKSVFLPRKTGSEGQVKGG